MLTELEFDLWCEKNNISLETKKYINNNIRFQQPARLVKGHNNSSGRYPSSKMGVSIQWESGKVEGPAVLMLENDENVLEYYDQPNKIKLNFIDNSGKRRGTLYTPDFFVIRKTEAGWEEWKCEEDLKELSKKQSWKYKTDKENNWICDPGEEFANRLGLTFKVCTESSINWNLHRNFIFLDDFLRRKNQLSVNSKSLNDIKKVVFSEAGITLKQLIEESTNNNFNADDVYVSVLTDKIYVDLNKSVLADPSSVKVFLNTEHEKTYNNMISCQVSREKSTIINFDVGTNVLWDSHIWSIVNFGNENVSLLSEDKYNEIPRNIFDELVNRGKITGEQRQQTDISPSIDILQCASEEDYKVANNRLSYVKKYLKYGGRDLTLYEGIKLRTVLDWVARYRKAVKLYSNGYLGLLPNDKNKGNRKKRYSTEVIEHMDCFIENEYETTVQKNLSVVYGAFKNSCIDKGYPCPSYTCFWKRVKNRPIDVQTRKRKGKRAQYQQENFYWELDRTTPRHGDFPFNICHLDHTELDIELICPQSGKNLGRPYLSLLMDAYSRRVLAYYLTFEPPSYRSCMMVFRDCVRRFNRLPQQVVVDNGKEFHSVYFESMLSMYEREIRRRPPGKPRFGSILERLFGTTNSNFIHNLIGNTKIMKNVREVTKGVNPKNLAVWSLSNLALALETYFFQIYDDIEHPSLNLTPKEAFTKGLFYSGYRSTFHIPYDKVFEILTLPSTPSGIATIQQNGIKINYVYYWNEDFKSLHSLKKKIKVRYDPYNIGVAYAYLNNRWLQCYSEHYPIFKNVTQKQLKFITAEIKKSYQNHAKNYTITARKIAGFIKSIEESEQYLIVKSRENENKNVVQLVQGGFTTKTEIEESEVESKNIVSDKNVFSEVTNLETYEEF
ncbi:TnsA endonuclease N-terminal domain-containing protein [Guptibacillus hwajinpoensis]|uniref:TnsA endonuclease N-terminal domain-containing protein n=1 Tax=Guptibacillus hwajinpoensis TaxID=208199 RepID=UPI0024B32A22|nr:TnsA endonuclease N-terminal domain-containing protein [Pseudalkalibacillus hwajinpoensis]